MTIRPSSRSTHTGDTYGRPPEPANAMCAKLFEPRICLAFSSSMSGLLPPGRMSDRSLSMAVTVALAGDTMLGRGVAHALEADPSRPLLAPEVEAEMGRADLCVLNLECCISDRGAP